MPLHDPNRRTFASDNYAGALPEVLAAIADANGGHQIAYGEDVYTARLGEVVRREFGERAEVFPVFNGTGANVVALQAMCRPWEAVICAEQVAAESLSVPTSAVLGAANLPPPCPSASCLCHAVQTWPGLSLPPSSAVWPM